VVGQLALVELDALLLAAAALVGTECLLRVEAARGLGRAVDDALARGTILLGDAAPKPPRTIEAELCWSSRSVLPSPTTPPPESPPSKSRLYFSNDSYPAAESSIEPPAVLPEARSAMYSS